VVDNAGHDHGPDAEETRRAIARVDSVIGFLLAGLARRETTHEVNLVIVSDHGMASTGPDRGSLARRLPVGRRHAGGRDVGPPHRLAGGWVGGLEGWTIAQRTAADPRPTVLRGNHGYDDTLPSMRAIFVAQGPAFRRGVTVPPFRSIHVYPLLAEVLDLAPAPTDGSLDSVRAMLRNQS
jgi:predicted AlkP superfamily pyrophosphatase or phosphodiesterase